MNKTLDVPTQPRNQREDRLLEEISLDPSLQNANLRRRVQRHINHNYHYVLVAWLHPSASIVKYSFEDEILARDTHKSYNNKKPIPKIVGIRGYKDLCY